MLLDHNGDFRPDVTIKEYFLTKIFKQLNIVKVWDDRPSVIRMWESHKLDVVNCGNGKEF